MYNPWLTEIWRALSVLIGALLLGWISGYVKFFLGLAFLGLFIWHLRHLRRFDRWLGKGAGSPPVKGEGIWPELYYHVYRLRQRHWRRKRTIAAYLDRFRQLTAALPDAAVVLRTGGEIEWFNEAAGRLLGLKQGQDVGQRIVNLVRNPLFSEYLASGRLEEFVEIPSPVDGRISLSITSVPYGNEEILLVARDVTRLHHLERMRRDFVANVSHELRTPLTVMTGFLETMADARDQYPAEWGRALHLMEQQAGRMRHIVEDLLLLSRLETGTTARSHKLVNVPAIIAAIREEAGRLSAGVHTINLEVDRDLQLNGDAEELHSAFANLVSNAIRYTPAGGKITLLWYADEHGAHFAVSDTGVGIAPQHIPRITERFYRVDTARSRQTGGTGLGLAIVKHVLERHQAELDIESRVGEGSTFRCDFPVNRISWTSVERALS